MNENFRNLINQGVSAAQSGNRELAEWYFKQAIQENPQDARGWYYYAQAVTDPHESRRALETVLQLDPSHEQARARLERIRFVPPIPAVHAENQAPWNNPYPGSIPLPYSAPGEAFPPRPASNPLKFILIGFIIVLAVGSLLVLWVYQASRAEPVTSEIKAILNANIRALEAENLADYMDTIHPDAPVYDQTAQITAQLLDQYDLEYEIEKMEMVSQSD
ncbi:MAG TPA: hypothetical protein VHO48_09580, partial [Anaerolineaceae bacterium]|nr:hypothetical protein [Anaerolineaceae bacterium]